MNDSIPLADHKDGLVAEGRNQDSLIAGQKQALELAASGASLETVLHVLAGAARQRAGEGARAAIFVADREDAQLRVGGAAGMSEASTRAMDGLAIGPHAPSCGRAGFTGEVAIVADVVQDPRWANLLDLAREHRIRASWSHPITASTGEVLGTIAVHHDAPREPSPGELEPIEMLAHTAAIVMERHKEAEERQRSEQLHGEQKNLLEMIASGRPLNECLSALCAAIPRLNAGVRASVLVADEQRRSFQRPVAPDLSPSFAQGLEGAPIIGTCGTAVYTGEPVVCSDIANDTKWSQEWRDLCVANSVLACHSSPIRDTNGAPLASFMLFFDTPRAPSKGEQWLADFGTYIASIALERDRSSRALRESEERYRRLFESVPVGAFVCDRSAVLQDYNRRAVELWGREPTRGAPDQRYCGSHKLYLPDGTRLPHDQSPMVQVLRDGTTAHGVEVFIERPDGSRIPVIVNFSPLTDPQGEVVGAITTFEDMTERRRTEEALRDSEAHLSALNRSLEQRVSERTYELRRKTNRLQHLAMELTTAEQRERKRLAAVLHDDLQQSLVAAQMQLGRLRGRVEEENAADEIARTEYLLDEVMTTSRNLTRQLRPPVLYEDGLVSALKGLAPDVEQRYRLRVDIVTGEEPPSLSDQLKALLFESIRELLINTAKHAGVDHATVEVRYEKGRLRLALRDGGRGFDPEAVAQADHRDGGFGLFSIRERLAALGGDFRIEAAPGEGARFELDVPVEAIGDDESADLPAEPRPARDRKSADTSSDP